MKSRSKCPITFSLEMIGDRWSLLVLRDIIFREKKHYHEFLESGEAISTNILADRLVKLEKYHLIRKSKSKKNKKKYIYSPTEKALDLIPMMIELIKWGAKYDDGSAAPPEVMEKIEKNPKAFGKIIRSQFNN